MRGRSRKALAPALTVTTGMVGEGIEIGTHVARRLGTAVDAADPAGGEHGDARRGRQRQRRRDRRRAELPLLRDRHRDVALGHLARRPEDPRMLVGVETDAGDAVEHRRHGRHRSAAPDRAQAEVERLGVGGRGQAEVGEDRRLQRHDRTSIGDRARDVVGEHRMQHAFSLPALDRAA